MMTIRIVISSRVGVKRKEACQVKNVDEYTMFNNWKQNRMVSDFNMVSKDQSKDGTTLEPCVSP